MIQFELHLKLILCKEEHKESVCVQKNNVSI